MPSNCNIHFVNVALVVSLNLGVVSIKMKKIIFVFICSLFFENAMADFLGLANGRSANLDNMAGMSFDGGVNVGGNGSLFGARVNFIVATDLLLFGDIGLLTVDDQGFDGDGLVYGLGAFYQLRNLSLLEKTHFAVKGAYHLGTADDDGFDIDYSEISFNALISGDQLVESDFGWYANAGVHILEADNGFFSDSDNEFLFGGGIIGPLPFGEFFAGVDFLDGALLVAGVRYNL